MGNTPVKRTPSKTGATAASSLKRSSSSHVPANHNRPRQSSIAPNIGAVAQTMPNVQSMRRRSSKGFHSAINIAANGHTGHPDGASDKYVLGTAHRDLIRSNWEPNRDRRHDISRRIYGRVFNKRPDIREIFEQIGGDVWSEETTRFADFIDLIIQNIDDLCTIEKLSMELGGRHGDWRQQGFKPEFWVALAESMTKECCYLDAAVHPAGEVLEAWSKLVGLIFGWARDGYYEKVRLQRRQSRKSIVTKSASISSRSLSNSSRSNSAEDDNAPAANARAENEEDSVPAIETVGTPPSDTSTVT